MRLRFLHIFMLIEMINHKNHSFLLAKTVKFHFTSLFSQNFKENHGANLPLKACPLPIRTKKSTVLRDQATPSHQYAQPYSDNYSPTDKSATCLPQD